MPRPTCDTMNGFKISLSDFERKQIVKLQTAQLRSRQIDNYTKLGVAALGTAAVGGLGYGLYKGLQYVSAGIAAVNSTYDKYEEKIQEMQAESSALWNGTIAQKNETTQEWEQANEFYMWSSVLPADPTGWELRGYNDKGDPMYRKIISNPVAGMPWGIGAIGGGLTKLFTVGTVLGSYSANWVKWRRRENEES